MGGEAAYVWSAYGITLAVVLFNAWWARWTHQNCARAGESLLLRKPCFKEAHSEASRVTPRRQRMLLIGLVLAGVAVAATFAIRAFQENLTFFITPTQVAEGHAPHPVFPSRRFGAR